MSQQQPDEPQDPDELDRLAATLREASAALDAAKARGGRPEIVAAQAALQAADAACWTYLARVGKTQPEDWRASWRPWAELAEKRGRRKAAWHRRWLKHELQTTVSRLARERLERPR